MQREFNVGRTLVISLCALAAACSSDDSGDDEESGGLPPCMPETVTCPEQALPVDEEWDNQPLRTRIMFFTGTRPIRGTGSMSNAQGTVEVRLTGNEVFLGGSCNYTRVPAEARVRVTPTQGNAVMTDFIPFNFKVYSRVRQSQVAGAEGNFCVGTQSASLTFLPDNATNGVLFQNFVLGLNLYVPPATP